MLQLLYDRDADLLLGPTENRPGAENDGVNGGVIDGRRVLGDGHGADSGAAHHP